MNDSEIEFHDCYSFVGDGMLWMWNWRIGQLFLIG